jgi:transcriptional regulator with XRE-family HTH domain
MGNDETRAVRRAQGRRLREARKQAGLTLAEIAYQLRQAGIALSPQAISSWERGTTSPRDHHRDAVCRLIGVDPADIFNGEDDQP